jgi:hypothetical protein
VDIHLVDVPTVTWLVLGLVELFRDRQEDIPPIMRALAR